MKYPPHRVVPSERRAIPQTNSGGRGPARYKLRANLPHVVSRELTGRPTRTHRRRTLLIDPYTSPPRGRGQTARRGQIAIVVTDTRISSGIDLTLSRVIERVVELESKNMLANEFVLNIESVGASGRLYV
ncbi:hypothetical protein EVAR_31653_1 [Eumeta japonica]|uniref:Uncharacterized protein n=1 Tax=Eumeta variegata TaxID=151549 RepID=A0A4C1W132_EUMVA|nr:hypothetical protein EVAR_31653_1 [Eumeta japonica]